MTTQLITSEDYETAPDDDVEAFVYLVQKAKQRLADHIRNANPQDDHEYDLTITEAQYSFVNVVVAVAKAHDIEQIATMPIPVARDFDVYCYRQFAADLEHYLMQMIAGNALRMRRDSFRLKDDVKARIRTHLQVIKEQIHAAGLSDARRDALLKRLTEFETALDKERINTAAIARFVFEMLSVTVGVAALSDSPTLQKLLMNVMQAGAEAKADEDEHRRLPPMEPMKALAPPRQEPVRRKPDRESFSADLDDEIPF